MKRILSLDGGGLRVFFTIEILAKIEAIVRRKLGRSDAVLSDYFDLIAGTSTGAILGAFLSWGLSIQEIQGHYEETARLMFEKNTGWLTRIQHRYSAATLSDFLRDFFVEDNPQGGPEATLGSGRLRTLFLAVMRNATTGSAWPLCNHPDLKYNNRALADCNLDIPLWRIVRASAAAPTFFEPECIVVGENSFQFVDGGITPYNNPALIATLMMIEPCYRINWESGENALHVVSVGAGRTRVAYSAGFLNLSMPVVAAKTISAMIEGATQQQDMLCRVMGRCLFGPDIDSETGPLIEENDLAPVGGKRFTYVRYDTGFNVPELAGTLLRHGGDIPMDLPELIPAFQAIGRRFVQENVQETHLH